MVVLPTPPLPHAHDQAVIIGVEFVDQGYERSTEQLRGRDRRGGGYRAGVGGEEAFECVDTDDVGRFERNLIGGQLR